MRAMSVEDNFPQSILSPRDRTQVIGLGSRCCCQLSLFTGPQTAFLKRASDPGLVVGVGLGRGVFNFNLSQADTIKMIC